MRAIERPDGPVVDALVEAGITVFVVAPNQLKNLRSRDGQAGTRSTGSKPIDWISEAKGAGQYAEVNGIDLYFATYGAGR